MMMKDAETNFLGASWHDKYLFLRELLDILLLTCKTHGKEDKIV